MRPIGARLSSGPLGVEEGPDLNAFLLLDDGSSPDKIAHVMGPPDRCEHAAAIINELLQSIRVRDEEGQGVSVGAGSGGGRGGGRGEDDGTILTRIQCLLPRVRPGPACPLGGVAGGVARGTGVPPEER